MKNAKRIVTGLAFTAVLALSLLASGGDADAKTKHGHDRSANIPSSPTSPKTTGITWEGVTWE